MRAMMLLVIVAAILLSSNAAQAYTPIWLYNNAAVVGVGPRLSDMQGNIKVGVGIVPAVSRVQPNLAGSYGYIAPATGASYWDVERIASNPAKAAALAVFVRNGGALLLLGGVVNVTTPGSATPALSNTWLPVLKALLGTDPGCSAVPFTEEIMMYRRIGSGYFIMSEARIKARSGYGVSVMLCNTGQPIYCEVPPEQADDGMGRASAIMWPLGRGAIYWLGSSFVRPNLPGYQAIIEAALMTAADATKLTVSPPPIQTFKPPATSPPRPPPPASPPPPRSPSPPQALTLARPPPPSPLRSPLFAPPRSPSPKPSQPLLLPSLPKTAVRPPPPRLGLPPTPTRSRYYWVYSNPVVVGEGPRITDMRNTMRLALGTVPEVTSFQPNLADSYGYIVVANKASYWDVEGLGSNPAKVAALASFVQSGGALLLLDGAVNASRPTSTTPALTNTWLPLLKALLGVDPGCSAMSFTQEVTLYQRFFTSDFGQIDVRIKARPGYGVSAMLCNTGQPIYSEFSPEQANVGMGRASAIMWPLGRGAIYWLGSSFVRPNLPGYQAVVNAALRTAERVRNLPGVVPPPGEVLVEERRSPPPPPWAPSPILVSSPPLPGSPRREPPLSPPSRPPPVRPSPFPPSRPPPSPPPRQPPSPTPNAPHRPPPSPPPRQPPSPPPSPPPRPPPSPPPSPPPRQPPSPPPSRPSRQPPSPPPSPPPRQPPSPPPSPPSRQPPSPPPSPPPRQPLSPPPSPPPRQPPSPPPSPPPRQPPSPPPSPTPRQPLPSPRLPLPPPPNPKVRSPRRPPQPPPPPDYDEPPPMEHLPPWEYIHRQPGRSPSPPMKWW